MVPSVDMRGGKGDVERREFHIFFCRYFFCSFCIFENLPSFSLAEIYVM